MLRNIILIASALALGAGPALADRHEGGEPPPPPPPDTPQLILMPPPDFVGPEDPGEPPADPEEAKGWLADHFHDGMDANGDGVVSKEELRAWVSWAHIPFMGPEEGEEPPPEGEEPPPEGGEPPPEGEEWAEGECGGNVGNQVVRSVSVAPGPANEAISLPAGREAGCFMLEVTGADIETLVNEFQIINDGSGDVVWHSIDDGQAAFEALVLTEGIYQIQLLVSDIPAAVFTVSFVDYPAGP